MKENKKQTTKELIGLLIKRQRLIKKLTQTQLADLLKTDRQYVWKIEQGKINLTIDYLDKIITKLNCTHHDFFNTKLSKQP